MTSLLEAWARPRVRFVQGDVRVRLAEMPSDHFDCAVTSPPYFGLRDYGVDGQIGLESTLSEYLDQMTAVCREIRRVLKPQGTFWLNVGDSYAGSGRGGNPEAGTKQGTNRGSQSVGVLYGRENAAQEVERQRIKDNNKALIREGLKSKDLMMVPARLALALQADGWYLRSAIVWHKPNPMPESVKDRPTSAHEMVYMLTKSERYFFDAEAVKEPAVSDHQSGSDDQWTNVGGTRNVRNVWTIATKPYKETHFATFPPELAERCVKAGCPVGGHVLDPFGGAGTTGLVAQRLGRDATLIELNPAYVEIARRRVAEG